MDITSVSCLYFSPTGTTKAIAKNIAQGMTVRQIDMFGFHSRRPYGPTTGQDSDLIILAVPVYYGRVPETALGFLNKLTGQGKPVVTVVVYGNREYEDALLELKKTAISRGFTHVAAGAFVAEHAYSTPSRPIGHGRPDMTDLEKAQAFGFKIKAKLAALEGMAQIKEIQVPGKVPYVEPKNLFMIRQARKTLAFTPETDTDKCTQCGLCAEICPAGAINPEDVTHIDKWQCIICFACIKRCPSQAKQMTDPVFNDAIDTLARICRKRKEPETYL